MRGWDIGVPMLMAESGWGWPRGFPRLPLHSTRNFVSGGPATAEISAGKVYNKIFFQHSSKYLQTHGITL